MPILRGEKFQKSDPLKLIFKAWQRTISLLQKKKNIYIVFEAYLLFQNSNLNCTILGFNEKVKLLWFVCSK